MAEMYNWDKSVRDDKSRRNTQIPSFSSTLLDEIYRSIDGGDEKFGEFKLRKQKSVKKQNGGGRGSAGCGGRGRFKNNGEEEDEETRSFRRACLVDKWMEMKGNKKITLGSRRPSTLPEIDPKSALDNDPLFFSSGSSSSDSSFGWHTEGEAVKPKHSVKKQNEFYLFNEETDKTNHNGVTKIRALKMYKSLKKLKQPISPGGRLTTFLNAIFTNGHSKKPQDSCFQDKTQTRSERKSKSTNVSTCSSASSFSRSCLTKNLPSSRDRRSNGIPRTLQFVDRDNARLYQEKCNKHDFAMIPTTYVKARTEKQKFTEFSTKFDYDKEDDHMASDSSSDLFELDHLAIFTNEEYCDELPVYETTHLGTNRAMA